MFRHPWWSSLGVALAVSIVWYLLNADSSPIRPAVPKTIAVQFIGGNRELTRRGDVIFIHGLNGDYRTTWLNESSQLFWPEAIAKDLADVGVWSIDYDAAPSDWLGPTMPLNDRSKQLLEQLRLSGLGKKPTIFVCHSLGGLVVKTMLRDALTQNNQNWEGFAKKTKGVMFLATPHTGSTQATFLNLVNYYVPNVGATKTISELEANNGPLRDWSAPANLIHVV
jgi:triacylglycerol esterase/lipase EstA (alpha/beta hydrolase family)